MTQILSGDDLWLPQTASMVKFRELRQRIALKMDIDESTIRPETRLAAIVPPYRRAEILSLITRPDFRSDAAVKPGKLPPWIGEITATTVVTLLCWWQPWFLALLLLPITILFSSLWRGQPSTIWPSCLETMHELALSQTHYNKEDAEKGLWPREEISAKVRWTIANSMDVGFDEITEETTILELC